MKKLLLMLALVLPCLGAWAQPTSSNAPQNGIWDANTTWFQIKNQKNKVLRADVLTSEGYLALTNSNATNGDAGLWCIVGSTESGYKFYNKALGTEVVLGMTGSEGTASAVFVAEGTSNYTTSFDIVASTDEGYWCMKQHGSTNNYWNERAPRLAYWANDGAQKGDDGSAFLFTTVNLNEITGYATEDEITAAQALIKVAPGYPKTTTAQYQMLSTMVNSVGKGIMSADLESAINAYKTCADVQLPVDGKAYTFTALFADGKKYNMNYTSGNSLSVSNEKEASIFVCKELRAGVYAFITEDGKILTWIGNNEGGAYKENSNILGYSSYFATTFNEKSDWNEITVKKNNNSSEQLGLLRLVARRKSDAVSSFIANTNKRFDQAGDANFFDANNTSGWIVTEVEHTNTEAQNVALAKIAVKALGYTFGTTVGQYYASESDEKIYDQAAVLAALDAKTSVDAVNTLKNSFTLNMPVAGKFYTFKNDNYYITSGETSGGRIALSETKDATAIYYFDGTHLLAYTTGKYFGLNANDWTFEAIGSTDISTITFVAAANGAIAKYNINSGTRWLHRTDAFVNRCSSNTCGDAHNWSIEEVTSLPVTISAAGYATFYAPVAVQVEGITANTVTVNGEWATLTAIEDGIVPAETGVILNGDPGTYNLTITETEATIESGLEGTIADTYVTEDAYILGYINVAEEGQPEQKELGFFTAEKNQQDGTAWLNNGFKAYLLKTTPANVLRFNFGGNTTAIESVVNGLDANAPIYDLSGRRVNAATKGIYIQNGKKFIVK